MGIYLGRSRSTYERCDKPSKQTNPRNPDPHKYEIIDSISINNFLIVIIKYPNCTNYEGKKILVYRNCTIEQLKNQAEGIDPHFCRKKYPKSPIARFEPTKEGAKMAVFFVQNYKD